MKKKKQSLFCSFMALVLCLSMLLGTTFAWFTDKVVSDKNIIASGNLDVALYHSNATVADQPVDGNTLLFMDQQGNPILWEPGAVSYENLRVVNEGSLALIYRLTMETSNENYVVDPSGAQYGLSQILKVGFVEGGIAATDREGVIAAIPDTNWIAMADFLCNGNLLPPGADVTLGVSEKTWGVVIYWEPSDNDNLWNLQNGKTLSEGEALSIDLGVRLEATQDSYESDAFGADYDQAAKENFFPVLEQPGTLTIPVTPDAENKIPEALTMRKGQLQVTIPAGVLITPGATALTLSVKDKEESEANINLSKAETLRSLDVHIDGIDPDNTVAAVITLGRVLPVGLNIGNYRLAHVENGETIAMTKANAQDAVGAHNEFYYEPATGVVTVAMATFSEVALVADTEVTWNGDVDHSWYDASKDKLNIANADQLWSFSQIVGGMAEGIAQDSFQNKTVKLLANINLADDENHNVEDKIFYPIGYNCDDGKYEKTGVAVSTGFYSFMGTFDGNGHTVSNFYQNTWEMKGDNTYYPASEQRYRDGMGLFGRIYGGKVKNLTVKNFSSDGEYTTTGTIAAYADCAAAFENISILNCNPRVYNIGNGGIVGCVGWYTKEVVSNPVTFTNITVDNSNKISALWGSYDVACGGIVGQYYPTSGQTSAGSPKNAGITLTGCRVAAQMDVYNDVCGNYQYYAYRYAGMLIGSVRENVTGSDGREYPKMDGITTVGCTVHYGDWNHYYYCEFEKNGHPSYSGPDDYKFSRVSRDEIVFDANGNAIGCTHNHTEAEDNRAIYLPFYDQLVTGYGWGVTSKGIQDMTGVTVLDRQDAASVVKFAAGDNAKDMYPNDKVADPIISIGELFKSAKSGVEIVHKDVQVFVSPANANSTVSGVYTANNSDWTKGTLTFQGEGEAYVTITDYNYCLPTTLRVTVRPYYYTISFVNDNQVLELIKVTKREVVNIDTTTPAVKQAQAAAEALAAEKMGANAVVEFDCWVNAGATKVTQVPADQVYDVVLYPKFGQPYTARFVDLEGNVISWCFFNKSNTTYLADALANARAQVPDAIDKNVTFTSWEVRKADGSTETYNASSFKNYTYDVTIYPVYTYTGNLKLTPVDEDKDGRTDYYKVEAVSKLDDIVEVPGYVNGIPVKIIDQLTDNRFATNVKEIHISDGTEIIAENALAGTGNLKIVHLPHSLKELGKNTFSSNILGLAFKEMTIYYDGTMAEFQAISKPSDWHNGLDTGTTIICSDGVGTLKRTYYVVGSTYKWTWTAN